MTQFYNISFYGSWRRLRVEMRRREDAQVPSRRAQGEKPFLKKLIMDQHGNGREVMTDWQLYNIIQTLISKYGDIKTTSKLFGRVSVSTARS